MKSITKLAVAAIVAVMASLGASAQQLRISDVVFTQDGMMRVSLTSPCGSDYSILATSTLQASTTINIQIDNGTTQVLLPIPAGVSGPFVVSLLNGDTVVDSRQIIQ